MYFWILGFLFRKIWLLSKSKSKNPLEYWYLVAIMFRPFSIFKNFSINFTSHIYSKSTLQFCEWRVASFKINDWSKPQRSNNRLKILGLWYDGFLKESFDTTTLFKLQFNSGYVLRLRLGLIWYDMIRLLISIIFLQPPSLHKMTLHGGEECKLLAVCCCGAVMRRWGRVMELWPPPAIVINLLH